MNKVFSLIAVLFVLSSCTAVKEYEKEYINDPEMKLSAKTAERYDLSSKVGALS